DQMMGSKPETYQTYAADIHSSGQHLLEIINDILDLSKAEGGYLELRARAFDVPKMLDRCVDTVRELARKVDIEIAVIVGKNLPALYGEERRIRQIVLNLLSNAVKFTPAGGCIGVRTDFTASGDLQLIVEDSGIGMTKNQIEVALTPFRQVESHLSRRYEGAGLGLPLARRFAELHEGTLVIDSKPDAGTRVTVTFPKDRLRAIPLRQVA
ncbi:MAG: HAMP domain-containing histidine kinase, partial [Rhodospirillaceae bacterium]|nr:HAMP domain-containing histidine kinase [Rhodospirillaceae bacterium]